MKLSTKTRYSLQLLTRLMQLNNTVRAIDLADDLNLSREYSLRLLSRLAENGIIKATKGPHGGFSITENTDKTILGIVMDAVNEVDARKMTSTSYNDALVQKLINSTVNNFRSITINELINQGSN